MNNGVLNIVTIGATGAGSGGRLSGMLAAIAGGAAAAGHWVRRPFAFSKRQISRFVSMCLWAVINAIARRNL